MRVRCTPKLGSGPSLPDQAVVFVMRADPEPNNSITTISVPRARCERPTRTAQNWPTFLR